VPDRTYSIGETSRQAKVSKHTLRYWEKALGGIIAPLRTQGGQRRYTLEHLLLLEEVKRLKQRGLSLAAIREELSQAMVLEKPHPDPVRLELLADFIAETVRTSVYRFFQGKKPD